MKPITIIGGGLAGLTLGIGLRRRGLPVTVIEAGNYPRHRVCGQFINGNGLAVLERLDLLPRLEAAGAFRARTAVFICGSNRSPVRVLKLPAWCLSRYALDALLAGAFRETGGELRPNTRLDSQAPREGWVCAAGRSPKTITAGWHWFGVKVQVQHADELRLQADLEMHLFPAGYVGVNRIEGGAANVCGLFRARPGGMRAGSKLGWLRGPPGSLLDARLARASLEPGSFCAVGGLNLRPRRAVGSEECRIGDALTMIPPVTGNGMSMAFESAEIAIEPLCAYGRGETSWREASLAIARACDVAFQSRLGWARRLQWLMFSPALHRLLGKPLLNSDRLWHWLYGHTR